MIEITAKGRTQTIPQWSRETGVSISVICSRRSRTMRLAAKLSPEQIVGLMPMNEPHNKGKTYSIKTKPNKAKLMVHLSEMPAYEMTNRFLRKGLMT